MMTRFTVNSKKKTIKAKKELFSIQSEYEYGTRTHCKENETIPVQFTINDRPNLATQRLQTPIQVLTNQTNKQTNNQSINQTNTTISITRHSKTNNPPHNFKFNYKFDSYTNFNQKRRSRTKMPLRTCTAPAPIVALMLSIVIAALLVNVRVDAASTPTPTCKSFGSSWYFPNSCVSDCTEQFSGSTMDIERSRNVNGDFRCYCVGQESPLCRDDPTCKDLEIYPGDALKGCQTICNGKTDVIVVDDVEYAGDDSAANKNQTHFRVGCSCGKDDDDNEQHQCGPDSILFSDLTYLPSCSSGITTNNQDTIIIGSAKKCFEYCESTNVFVGGIWTDERKSCGCTRSVDDNDIDAELLTMACDDSQARANDGSGLGDPCYENVGVSAIDCSELTSSSTTTATGGEPVVKQTLVSSAAIMGIWLLPW